MAKSSLPAVTSDIPRDLRLFVDRVREAIGSTATRADVVRVVSRITGKTPGGDGGGGDGGGGGGTDWDGWDDDDWEDWLDGTDWWDESDRPDFSDFPDIEQVMEALSDQLNSTELAKYLAERINLIEVPSAWIREVTRALEKKVEALRTEITDTILQLADGGTDVTIQGKSGYTSIRALKVSTDLSSSAIVAINDVSATSGSANARQLAGLQSVIYDPETGLEKAQADITQLNTLTVTSTSANAKATAQLTATVYDPKTGLAAAHSAIVAINDVSATSGSANARQLAGLQSVIYDPETGLEKAHAAILEESETRVSEDEALASQITSLSASLTTATNQLNASITDERTARTTADSALAQDLTTLSGRVTTADGKITAAQADITQLNTLTVTSTSANAKATAQLTATVYDPKTGLAAAHSAIVAINDVSATSDSALARKVVSLDAELDTESAKIRDLSQATVGYCTIGGKINSGIANKDACTAAKGTWVVKPLAEAVTQVSTSWAGGTLSIEQLMRASVGADGAATGLYSVKIDGNGHVTGFGLSSEIINGRTVGSFIVKADRFAIAPPNSTSATYPFIVDGSNTYINTAIIKDATIEGAKIKDLAVGTAKIANGAIESAKIKNGAITTAHIQDATILAAKIKDGEINNAKIADGAITTAKIGEAQITSAKIASLSASKLTAGTIDAGDIILSSDIKSSILTKSTAGNIVRGWHITGDGYAAFADAQIRGVILGGDATSIASGTGLFSGASGTDGGTASTYRFRVGNPSGARMEWDGSQLKIYRGGQTAPVLETGETGASFTISSDAFKITNGSGTLTPFLISNGVVYIDELKLKSGNVPSGLIVGASGSWSSTSAPVPADVPMSAPGNLIVIVTVNCYTLANGQQSTVWVTPNMGVKGSGPSQSGPAAGQTLPADHDGNVCTAHMFNVSTANTYGASAAVSLSGTGHAIGSITISAIWAIT